jgi:uncharacterized protein YndB with AHSA1/START domain
LAITERSIDATPAEVFEVLLDPFLYEHWVVGAKEIRGADESWPAVGSAFHHRVGGMKAEVKDKTEILELDAPHRIALRTFARPFGLARVIITARPAETGTIVTIFERPEEGTKLRALTGVVDPVIHLRNIEALRRLDRVTRIRARCKDGPRYDIGLEAAPEPRSPADDRSP